MANPFEDEEAVYLVLVNDEAQHSLWPESITVPPGWKIAKSGSSRPDCLAYIESHWTDMRPRTLQLQMNREPTD